MIIEIIKSSRSSVSNPTFIFVLLSLTLLTKDSPAETADFMLFEDVYYILFLTDGIFIRNSRSAFSTRPYATCAAF